MSSFEEKLLSYKSKIESFLKNAISDEESFPLITSAMKHSLLAGGKRLRGALVLAFYEELGGKADDALFLASSVEMVHAYSLIHDDLPCMDDDDMRRGKPSNHIVYGYANALLAGDALLTYAFELASSETAINFLKPQNVIKAINILAKNAGYKGMVGGQVLDLDAEGKEKELSEMEYINSLKTGKLITASCLMGAYLMGVDEETEKAIISYGQNLGVAFQIADDILDVTGSEEKLGKPIGSDKENKKTTFVTEYGVKRAEEIALSYSQRAIDALRSVGINNDFLFELAIRSVKRES